MIDSLAFNYGWGAVEKIGIYQSMRLLDKVSERESYQMLNACISFHSEPKALYSVLFKKNTPIKTNTNSIEIFKNSLSKGSGFKIK